MKSMDQNDQNIISVPMENIERVIAHIRKGEMSSERNENSTTSSDPSKSMDNVFSWTLPQNQFISVPCHNFRAPEENAMHRSQLDSFCRFSQSQTFLKDKSNKEVESFNSPSCNQVMRQKAPSADDIYDSRSGILLHFSPGTHASNTTLKNRLEQLRKSRELRKTSIKKSSLSHGRISLHQAEKRFLSSAVEPQNFTINSKENDGTDVSFRFPLNASVSFIADSSKTTNATYVIQPSLHEVELSSDFAVPTKEEYTKTEMERKIVHLAALTSWLNYLLDEKNLSDDSNQFLIKNKKDADRYLRKLLMSGNDLATVKDNEPQSGSSYKCFTAANELSEMRARFRLLYKSSSIPKDIATIVKDGKIAVRMDRRVYADVGLQTELLSLLLTFHPFYLRLGLETILSIEINTGNCTKSHLRSIASIVTQNIFKNPKIMKDRKFVQGTTKMLINERGAEVLLKHFLTKICQFLFIVCEAWQDSIISRKNRCLFVKWSTYKSICDVVAVLSRELITGSGNLPKILSRLGLFLDRKQGFFEEFEYHVTDLLKDLGNGMILGRTVEILANLQYNTVIHCLRDPGGDRIRKINNIKTVINFAKREGILPEDLSVNIEGIVQGNIDDIIFLLWRFVDKELGNARESDNCLAEIDSISQQLQSLFGISYEISNPLQLADGKLFSLLWKRYYSYGTPYELFNGTTVLEQIANAAEYHFGIPSSMLVKWKHSCEEKTLCLFTKIFISRIYECHRYTCAAVTIQRAFRRYRMILKINSDVMKNKTRISCETTSDQQEEKVIIIQKFIRGWLARKFFRRLLNEYNEKERENASVVIQKYFRSWLARKSFRKMQHEILQKQENAACILQKFTRRWLAQKSYKKLLDEHNAQEQENASLIIQKCIRSWLARKSIRKMRDEKTLQKREDAARILQRYIRRWIARKNNQKKQRVELVPHEQGNITLTLQNSIVTMDGATDEVGIKEAYDCKIISDVECLQMLRELKRRHNCLRKRRQNFLRAVEDKMRLAIILKEEKDRRIKAATLIQARWRGYNLRKHCEAICNKLTATRIARNEVASSEEKAERMQPIINRVMTEMGNLNSDRLYVRYRATEVLYKFVGLSQLCAQYVFENGGLECILDSLEGCNRGVGSTEVVIRLCSVMWSVLKFKAIRDKLCESRQQDIVKQCYHFMLAFHRVPDVVTYLSRIVVALDGQQYKKASYFVAELTKKFAKLSGCDERIIALRNLQNHLN